MKFRYLLKPSYPKAIFATSLLCAFVFVKYRQPSAQAMKTVHVKKAIPKVNTIKNSIAEAKQEVVIPPIVTIEKAPIKKITTVRIKKIQKPEAYEQKLIEALDEVIISDAGINDAVDVPDLMEELAYIEDPLDAVYALDITLKNIRSIDESIMALEIEPQLVQEGELKENSFEDIIETLADIKKIKIEPTLTTHQLKIVRQETTRENNKADHELKEATENVPNNENRPNNSNQPENGIEEVDDNEPTYAEEKNQLIRPTLKVQANVIENNEQEPAAESKKMTIQKSGYSPGASLFSPIMGGVGKPNPTTPRWIVVKPAANESQKKEESKEPTPTPQPHRTFIDPNENDNTEGGIIEGRLSVDKALDNWLIENKGHIQLYLHRLKSKDPQDLIFVSYQFPDQDFQINAKELQGKYELIANIFSSINGLPVYQATYEKLVYAENYKENILFNLKKNEIISKSESKTWASQTNQLNVNLTLFEGASGSHREPKSIKNAKIKWIGFPERGEFQSDSEGNAKIEGVPPQSEVLLEITANGYYSTRQTIPIFQTHAYQSIYLIERAKIETITNYFTKKPQEEKNGLIMGRIYDSESRAPKKEDSVYLSERKGHALYFGALPNISLKETTSTGLFAFLNVPPSFRYVSREKSELTYLQSVKEGQAQYIEFGRGGEKALRGKLYDPFSKEAVQAKLRILGQQNWNESEDEDGSYEFAKVDLPASVITLEVEAEGYPLTWVHKGWSTREPELSETSFMVPSEVLNKVFVKKADKYSGRIFGGVHPKLFSKELKCIKVRLQDENGKLVTQEKGPYPLYFKRTKPDFCLTKKQQGFVYDDLPAGEYLLSLFSKNGLLKTKWLRVGSGRVSVVAN